MRDMVRILQVLCERTPDAAAWLKGSAAYPELEGCISFYDLGRETLVVSSISGLPQTVKPPCSGGFLGFHIHEGGQCSGNAQNPFAGAGTHYNPYGCEHPFHAGDMPPVLNCNGSAWSAVLTAGFSVSEVTGRTVILHQMADDFHTQPSGNSGNMIGCGRIIAQKAV